jgi:hypothetical protein
MWYLSCIRESMMEIDELCSLIEGCANIGSGEVSVPYVLGTYT